MSYRPICDVWILGRPKVKYYGAFPNGFLHRARNLLGVGINDAVLHICGGMIRKYPCRGFGPNDKTLDLNPACEPDFLMDARLPYPMQKTLVPNSTGDFTMEEIPWPAVLIDRPYSEDDAEHYPPGKNVLPSANLLVKLGIAAVAVGGKVGIIDYVWPQPPKNATEQALIAVGSGRNNRARWFTVFERMS